MGLDEYTLSKCPACGGQLREYAIGSVAIDGCDACGGCWFDGQELKQVANLPGEPLEAIEMEFAPGLSVMSGGGSGKCPRCKVLLAPKHLKQAKGIEFDVCPQCQGMWLDEGELDQLGKLLPKRTGPMPPPDPQAARGAAVAGLLRTVICPHCAERSPELSERCSECGKPLYDAPAGGIGELQSSHGLSLMKWVNEALLWMLVLGLCLWPGNPLEMAGLGLGERIAIGLVLLLVLGIRWLFKANRIDAAAGGLLVHKPVGDLFIPWDAIRKAAMFDTGTRSILYPVARLFQGDRYGTMGHGWGRQELMDEHMDDWLPQGIMVLYTTRGLVVISRNFVNHTRLIQYIRDRL